ncbi:hypothetical protein [Leucothrix pacifica]|uniref:hypothetical protein n=1 Tax=Leucothrix pacifica TaxID=1247513 RepID=UPI0015E83FB8|nr:hypothetical protein [Leucothrix pacifica]
MTDKAAILVLILASGLAACSNPNKDCLKADAFGHCKQWKDQPNTCEKPDFLGFCPGNK